jgi:5'-3' exonuclease
MGIPFFAKTITQKYPSIVLWSENVTCHNLFLDLNCAIHQCAQAVLARKTKARCVTKLENSIIEETIRYIHKIVNTSTPSDTLFVAIDGLPPRAKLVQQRKRRYISAWRNPGSTWDTNAITPGTPFMDKLSSRLSAHFSSIQPKCPYNIIFKDSNTYGEGEAKIIKHIRAQCDGGVCVVYGLDADLVMLGLTVDNIDGMLLMREPAEYNVASKHPFLYFDIERLKKSIDSEYKVDYIDFVFLCFLLGNDFLPPLSFLKIQHNGIESLLTYYNQVKNALGQTIVNKETKCINYKVLAALFDILKDSEDASMCAADKKYYEMVARIHPKLGADKRLAAQQDNFPTIHKFPDIIKPGQKGWRPAYYHHLFQITDVNDVHTVCLNYLEGLAWNFNYYLSGDHSWTWYYQYAYSPTIVDLCNFMLNNSHPGGFHSHLEESITRRFDPMTDFYNPCPKTHDSPKTPSLQLLLVLPTTSRQLLPKQWQGVDVTFPHFFPSSFEIATYMKRYLWECNPKLPPINASTISTWALAQDGKNQV